MTANHRFKPETEPNPCSVEGCTKPRASTHMCRMHHSRMKRTGTAAPRALRPANLENLCPIGRNILALRMKADLSVSGLAARCDINRSMIQYISKGGSTTLDTLRTIASVFNVEAWELMKPDHFPLSEDVHR